MEKKILNNDSGLKQSRLLIVDDVDLNRALLAEIFKNEYEIEEAENGQECLEKVLDHGDKICAVLLDVVMPVMNGIEVLKIFSEKGLVNQIPVFLITAEASDHVIEEGYALGAMDIIGKPVVPYVVQRRVNSIVELFRARERLGETVAEQQSEISQQAQKIIDLNLGMIESLSTAIEFRSCESGEHVRRIRDITYHMLTKTRLGEGLTNEQIDLISLAAIMHDVGKIAVSDSILNKPGRLTDEEYEIMQTHTTRGAELLDQIPQMRNHEAYIYARDIALHHHERWDGRGYPDGLKGDEISVWAQIVSLADVYDALISKRVYKDAFSCEQALQMIRDGQCGVFNPVLLDVFAESEPEIRKIYQS